MSHLFGIYIRPWRAFGGSQPITRNLIEPTISSGVQRHLLRRKCTAGVYVGTDSQLLTIFANALIGMGGTPAAVFAKKKMNHALIFSSNALRYVLFGTVFLSWIGFSWAPPNTPRDHLLSFASLSVGKKKVHIFSGLWICIVWVWWKWRNAIVFEKKEWNIHRIIEEVKCRF